MNFRDKLAFTGVAVIIGIMAAIQFRSHQEPIVQETRDPWELRHALLEQQQKQSKLLKEITVIEGQIAEYETERSINKEQALRAAVAKLKEEAGLTEIKGKGIILTITPSREAALIGNIAGNIPPDLLTRLINELNMYEAKEISINGQRIRNTTVIRDISGQTKIDGLPLRSYPIEIKVIGPDANKLKDRMRVSQSMDDFFLENLEIKVSAVTQLSIPANEKSMRIRYMEPVNKGNGDNE
ncbi:DUF881 domain-containing protein [Peribacillus sp. SCS-155]|uniref:DUF881 domain-containing protein n=1 Tax=Peribacillus sedimenti TaxID=3115297 RepID=UPI0039061F4B